jgi:hypothetical protein
MAQPFEKMVLIPKREIKDRFKKRRQQQRRRKQQEENPQKVLRGQSITTEARKQPQRADRGFEFVDDDIEFTDLDKRIHDLLKRKHMLDMEKYRLYNLLSMQNFKKLRQPVKIPKRSAALATAAAAGTAAAPEDEMMKAKSESDVFAEVVGNLSPSSKNRSAAEKIIAILAAVPKDKFRWDKLGRIVVDQRIIHNSNISELITDCMRKISSRDVQTSPPPLGWRKFKQVLIDSKIPAKLIKNEIYLSGAELKHQAAQEAAKQQKETTVHSPKHTRAGSIYGKGKNKKTSPAKWLRCHR